PGPGDLVRLEDAGGAFLAWGFYSPSSQIRVRAVSFDEAAVPSEDFIRALVRASCKRRGALLAQGNEGVRLIASEGDLLPGIVADRYGKFIVISISSQAMEACREWILAELMELYPECSLYERSDTKARQKEGLEARCGVIRGDEPPEVMYVLEGGQVRIPVEIPHGHKTGAYLDQRAARIYASSLCKGRSVLNCFSYTGGFGLWALKGGARSVVNVDVSAPALEAARQGVVENHLDPGRCKFVREDVFDFLRAKAREGAHYDVVILDPPKFAESAASLKRACRGYQDIARLGFSLLEKGGRLLTFSCSGLVDPALFQKITADAALDAGVQAQIVRTLRQDCDHPVSLPCPESFYLKGIDAEVI
ncbi:MAG: class I SAM-dependent rRNA methyltransferase, partial [Succinivibrio sp.]